MLRKLINSKFSHKRLFW